MEDERDVVALWRGLVLVQSLKAPSMRGAEMIDAALRRAVDGGVWRPGVVAYVAANVEPPGEDVRRFLAKSLSDPRYDIAGHLTVFAGTGFRATVVRSVLTAISLFSRSAHPQHVTGSMKDGVAWMHDALLQAGTHPAPEPAALHAFAESWFPAA